MQMLCSDAPVHQSLVPHPPHEKMNPGQHLRSHSGGVLAIVIRAFTANATSDCNTEESWDTSPPRHPATSYDANATSHRAKLTMPDSQLEGDAIASTEALWGLDRLTPAAEVQLQDTEVENMVEKDSGLTCDDTEWRTILVCMVLPVMTQRTS